MFPKRSSGPTPQEGEESPVDWEGHLGTCLGSLCSSTLVKILWSEAKHGSVFPRSNSTRRPLGIAVR